MIFPVIMAGGKGERFWPYSTTKHPKQLLPLVTKQSMLEDTLDSIKQLKTKAPIHIIVSKNLEAPIKKMVGRSRNIVVIGEPVGRNTAAAIGLAVKLIERIDPKGVMVVLTADHAISPHRNLAAAIREAARIAAQNDTLVTFGIQPTRPDTGFGYIEVTKPLGYKSKIKSYQVRGFREKPGPAQAKKFLKSGRYYWNSGMFVWRIDYLWSLFEAHLPEMYRQLNTLKKTGGTGKGLQTQLKKIYARIKGESIDYGIMEHAPDISLVVPEIKWDDIGSWTALDRRHPADKKGNVVIGNASLLDCDGLTTFSDGGLIAAFGVKDLLLVKYGDVTLVVHKDKRADLKKLVEQVRSKKLNEPYL